MRRGRVARALAVVACAIAATCVAGEQPLVVRVSTPSPFALCDVSGEVGTNYLDAAVEPQIAIDPRTTNGPAHLVGVWQQDRWSNGGARGIAVATSADDGRTWTEGILPFGRCAPDGLAFQRVSDPWISIGPDGTAYATATTATVNAGSQVLDGVVSAVSHDGGKTWTDARALSGSSGGEGDRVVADPARPGVAYAVWPGGVAKHFATVMSRTVDGGRTWSSPRRLLRGRRWALTAATSQLLAGPGGVLHVVTIITRKHNSTTCHKGTKGRTRCRPRSTTRYFLGMVTSSDGGAHWSHSVVVAPLVTPPSRFGPSIRAVGAPISSAIDPKSGRIYVAWEDGRYRHGTSFGLSVTSSPNGWRAWSRAERADQAGPDISLIPTIAVASDGTVGVMYYSTPFTTDPSSPVPTDLMFVDSRDHGHHFSVPTRIAGPFDFADAPQTGDPPDADFIGDYEGMTAGQHLFYPFFVMADQGARDRSDVFCAVVDPADSTAARSR